MNVRTSQTIEVSADGGGLISNAGTYLLSAPMAPTRDRRSAHDPVGSASTPLLCHLAAIREP